MEGLTSGIFLTCGKEVHLPRFLKHSSVAHELFRQVHHCTAVWLIVKRKEKEE